MNVVTASTFNVPQPGLPAGDMLSDDAALRIAASVMRFHHMIDRELGSGMFDNPALLMLLELFIARSHGRQMTVKSLTLASGVPQSTAQRWIDRLQAQKLVDKHVNRADRRSAHVNIADSAVIVLKGLLGRLDAACLSRTEHWG